MIHDRQVPAGSGVGGDVAYVRRPEPGTLFTIRAERLAALATGHALSGYLELLSRLARAQHVAWSEVGRRARGTGEALPIPRLRDPGWRAALRVLGSELARGALPPEGRGALDRLGGASIPELEAFADRVLANQPDPGDLAAAPLVAAALQVHFAALAAEVDPAAVPRAVSGCPVCGSLPVAGVILGDDRLRYLACGVCATQWHHTRIQCTACRSAEHLTYLRLDGQGPATAGAIAVKAEACGACRAYTKLFYLDADPRIEPLADDVATLSLDLLMAEEGWSRHGVNPLLLPGELAAS